MTTSTEESFSTRLSKAWKVYTEPRTFIILLLGFSSGLPFLLVFSTLSAWLREAGISRSDIGLMSYVGLFYTIKFLWAPIIDQLKLPGLDARLGKRRSWMLLAQAVIAAALIGMSFSNPSEALMPVVIFALILAFASATQDIVIDAWRIEAAEDEKQGAMAAAYQLGYRLAIIASGAGALYLAEFFSWSTAYLAMAALMSVGVVAALLAPQVAQKEAPIIGEEAVAQVTRHLPPGSLLARLTAWLYRAVAAPFIDFFGRHGWSALLILALIGLYRLPDFTMGVMANPLYIDIGFSLVTIGTVVKLYGVWMTILGAVVGGLIILRVGILRAMLFGVSAASLTNLLFAWLATRGPSELALIGTISAENFSGGFAGTCLIAYMSSLTNHAFTATQYALFSSVYALPGKLLGGLSGIAVDWFSAQPGLTQTLFRLAPGLTEATAGYVPFFILTGLTGLPAILLIFYLLRRPGEHKA